MADGPAPDAVNDWQTVDHPTDWQTVPKHDFSSLTANPKGEGTYKVKTSDGQNVDVPYSNVPVFTQGLRGNSFASPEEQTRFEKDAASDPKKPSFWRTLTNPVGIGAHDQGIVGGAEQIGGQAAQALTAPLAHLPDTVVGLGKTAGWLARNMGNPVAAAVDPNGNPVASLVDKYQQDQQQGGNALALENLAGNAIGSIEGGRLGGATAETVGSKLPSAAPLARNLYESALKPSTTLSAGERANLVNTGLTQGIAVSSGGLEKLGTRIDELNQAIRDQVAADPARPIDPNAVATRVDALKPRLAQQVNASEDIAAAEGVKQQFLAEQGARPGVAPKPTGILDAQGNPIMTAGTPAQPAQPMSAEDAQAMKQGTYRALGGKNYGELKGATIEAQKSLARGLKEEIANQFPEITKLNADEGRLLDLQPILERAVNRISNHQMVGIGTPIAGTAAKAITGSSPIGTTVAVLKAVVDDPFVKSRLAIALSKGAKIPYAQAAARVAAYSGSLESNASAPQGSQGDQKPSE